MIHKLLFLFSFIPIFSVGFSQKDTANFSIVGIIKDRSENKTLEYINLTLLSAKDSSFIKNGITNQKGKFKTENIRPGNYILRITAIAYKPEYKKIQIRRDTVITVFLTKKDTQLDEVTVTANKEIYALETDKRIYLTANDESIQNAFAEDAVENAPGVYIDINGSIIVRGQNAQIWVNGKPTKKTQAMLQNYLETMPASQIKRIEVITNPSAEYSATNTNIIVNIVLKKNPAESSLFALGIIYTTMPRYGVWTTYFKNSKNIDFNFYVYTFTKILDYGNLQESFSQVDNDTSFYSKITEDWNTNATMIKPYFDLTYKINKKTSLTVKTIYQYYNKTNQNTISTLKKYSNPYEYNANSIGFYYNSGFYGAIDFDHSFNKKKNALYISLSYTNMHEYFGDETEEKTTVSAYKTLKETKGYSNYLNLNIRGDYTHVFNKNLKTKTGFVIKPIYKNNYENLVDTSSYKYKNSRLNEILSQKYTKDKPIYEFYTTFSGKILLFHYKIGLRYERDNYILNQFIPESNLNKKYDNFYPSLHISYRTKSGHSFSLSYSRRVNTPVNYLNPYIDRSNIDYISTGNPNLQFAAVNSFDFTYFKNIKNGNLTFSLYEYNTKNDIDDVNEIYFDEYFNKNVVLQTYANCANKDFVGSEFSFFKNIYKTIKIRLNTDLYYKQIDGEYKNNVINKKTYAYTGRFSVSHKFFNKFNLKIISIYHSKEVGFFQTEKYDFYVNSSLNFDVLKKRFSFYIKAEDIFDSRFRVTEYQIDNFYLYYQDIQYYPRIKFSVVYRIGNSKYDRQAKINQLAR